MPRPVPSSGRSWGRSRSWWVSGHRSCPLSDHPPLVIGLLDDRYTRGWERHGITGLDLHRLPHTLPRAREMDALRSQAAVTGYKAAMLAADTFADFLGTPATASGSGHPARVLVLGAGVAGMEAIATATRLGADVTGYDVRAAAREAVLTQGARLLTLPGVADVTGAGGQARTLTGRERRGQKIALAEHMADFDIVITCAALPGRRPPPELIDARGLAVLAPGSVVVDTASGPLGGNVAGSVPGSTVVRANGVVLIGASDLPRRMAHGASAAYARCVVAVLRRVVADDGLHVDPADDVIGPMLVGASPSVNRVPGPETIPGGTSA